MIAGFCMVGEIRGEPRAVPNRQPPSDFLPTQGSLGPG
jgi:hypothetical protein